MQSGKQKHVYIYLDLDYTADKDNQKSILKYVIILNRGAVL